MEFKKFTRLTMLLSLSVVLNIFESIIPLFNGIIPGLKLGLANSIILLIIYLFSFKDALYVSILRVFLVGILRNGLLLSVVMMSLAKNKTKLSIIGVSIIGSITHSIGQIMVAMLVLKTHNIIYYLPWLLVFSIPTGIFIGMISKELVKYFEKRLKFL
jgi:heptaprenyl diphosphate synthase